jgi:hypothetical protein
VKRTTITLLGGTTHAIGDDVQARNFRTGRFRRAQLLRFLAGTGVERAEVQFRDGHCQIVSRYNIRPLPLRKVRR